MPSYASGADLWSAARHKARAAGNTNAALREFVYDRFLARLFAAADAPWILKGGNAILSRSPFNARATTDIDLGTRTADDINAIQVAFAEAIALDLADHFRFTIAKAQPHPATPAQPQITGATLTVDAWCGARRAGTFRVDLVAGSLITAQPETITRTPTLTLDGYPPATVIVYPVVDHIADKICATAQLYNGKPSSRARDLVDLVVLTTTQRFTSHRLRDAITLEWEYRQLSGTPAFDPPANWAPTYTRLAAKTPACANHPRFDHAVDLVQSRLLQPIWAHVRDHDWEPESANWMADPGAE